jgi:hypothetical protein
MKNKHHEILEKIANLIAQLPSEELLKPDLTPDQIAEWEKCRRVQLLLAEEWGCRYVYKNHRYPIEEARDRGEITKAKARLYLAMIVETEKRWELVQAAEPLLREFHEQLARSPELQQALLEALESNPLLDRSSSRTFLKKIAEKYPFKTDFDLFAYSLKEEADYVFSSCLESYKELSIKKCGKVLDTIGVLLETNHQLNETSLKLVKKIKNNLGTEKLNLNWWTFTLSLCKICASTNPDVEKTLTAYEQFYEEMLGLAKTVTRQVPSKAWKQGKLLHGTKHGGIYR